MRVQTALVTVMCAGLLAASAAAAGGDGPAQIVVGATLPLTGGEAKVGVLARNGYELAFAEAMERGGLLVGARRVPVRLELRDDGTDPARAAALATQLVARDGARLLLGSISTPVTEAQSAAAEKLRVPYVTSSGAASTLYQRGFQYLFSVCSPSDHLGITLAAWLDDQRRSQKLPTPLRISLAWENTGHGKDFRAGVLDYLTKTPERKRTLQVVSEDSFDLNQKDFAPLLARVKAAQADVYLVDAHLQEFIAMQKQYTAMKMCHKVLSYGARGTELEARRVLPPGATDYALSAVWWNGHMGNNAVAKAFVGRFQARHHREPEWYEALAYEAARALFTAVERAGSVDADAVRLSLGSLRMQSLLPGGWLAFPTEYGHQARYLFVVQQNMPDGTSPVVYPLIAQAQEGVAVNPRCAQEASAQR